MNTDKNFMPYYNDQNTGDLSNPMVEGLKEQLPFLIKATIQSGCAARMHYFMSLLGDGVDYTTDITVNGLNALEYAIQHNANKNILTTLICNFNFHTQLQNYDILKNIDMNSVNEKTIAFIVKFINCERADKNKDEIPF